MPPWKGRPYRWHGGFRKPATSPWEKTSSRCAVTTKVVHLPGNDHHVADAMSRYPIEMPKEKAWKTWETRRRAHARAPTEDPPTTRKSINAESNHMGAGDGRKLS